MAFDADRLREGAPAHELDYGAFDALTFDCYGTLIDQTAGALASLRPIADRHGIELSDDELFEVYARDEIALVEGPYLRYREALEGALQATGRKLGFEPTAEEVARHGGSVGDWPEFPDSPEALARLERRYKLAVITNCDDDLFALSNERLGVEFDVIVTAEQVRSYKPTQRNFDVAFERLGLPKERILHVAQSLLHDHVPAKRMGLTSVWIDRYHQAAGDFATRAADWAAVEPSARFSSLAAFADAALGR